jgi:hypothetical protein
MLSILPTTIASSVSKELALTGSKALAANIAGNTVAGSAIAVEANLANAVLDGKEVNLGQLGADAKFGAIAGAIGTVGGEATKAGLRNLGSSATGPAGSLNGFGRIAAEAVGNTAGNSGDVIKSIGSEKPPETCTDRPNC